MKLFGDCRSCQALQLALSESQRVERSLLADKHTAELRAVKAETLAETFKLEIERLDRIISSRQAPVGGGFMPMAPPEPDEIPAAPDSPDFAQRLDELYGDGLPLPEIERRHLTYRQQELNELQAEKDKITAELRSIQGIA